MFLAPLAVLAGFLLVTVPGVAEPISSETATPAGPAPDTAETVFPPAPSAPVMVEDAASPTRFGDEKPDADFRIRGSAEDDPYQAILREIVVGAAPTRGRAHQAPTTVDDDAALNFNTKEELKARIAAVKGGLASLMGNDGRTEQSEEARELELERRIAMRGAYNGARLAGGADAATGTGAPGGREQRNTSPDEEEARLYLLDLAFFVWDVLTHPATMTALVLIAIFRAALFVMRFAPRTHRVRRHHGKRRRSRSNSGSPQVAATVAVRRNRRGQYRSGKAEAQPSSQASSQFLRSFSLGLSSLRHRPR